ncbi:hypothetical protein UJ101_02390 [Flavobacteriaceae bacterium UJ101]|nr:hypothetical protein UJ101_02390 [Flavobacteriaceae bacterium UJ101]
MKRSIIIGNNANFKTIYMTILYIEDDALDKRNMEWVCSNIETPSIHIIHTMNFQEAENILQSNEIDFIITDQSIDHEYYTSYENLFQNHTYYVLTNNINEKLKSNHKPQKKFTKPFVKEHLHEILHLPQKQDSINLNYFEQFSASPKLQFEMLSIIINEFQNTLNKIDTLTQQPTELASLLHKLCSKFSVLGMEKTYQLVKKTEESIINTQTIDTHSISIIKQELKSALLFLKNNTKNTTS